MNLEDARALIEKLPHDQRLAMAIITTYVSNKSMVKGYELGLEHGENGTRVSPEFLFTMLDPPE